jgi:hypothetical protein
VVAIAVIWFIAAVISVIPLIGFGNFIYSGRTIACSIDYSLDNDYYAIFLLVVAIVAVSPVIVCNTWVCCIVQRNIRAIYKIKGSTKSLMEVECYQTLKEKRHEKGMHLCKVFGSLLCLNLLSWLPAVITSFITLSGVLAPQPMVTFAALSFLSQATVHPIMETTLIKEVREPLKKTLFKCCVIIKAKLTSDKEHDQEANKSNEETTITQCEFLHICGAAILFGNYQHSKSEAVCESV